MNFTNIKDLKYSKADNSTIDLIATCVQYGEIPMTLNLVDTEDLYYFATGKFEVVIENGKEIEKEILIPLEEYCKTLKIAPYSKPTITEEQRIALIKSKANEIITSKYSDIKQRNILMSQDIVEIGIMNSFILNIRTISNDAETKKTPVEQINWEIK